MQESREPSWDDYRFFAEVARAGSIRAAARALGVDHATVSRRIAKLEARLAVQLLVRGAAGVTLTEAGDELRAAALAVSRTLDAAGRRIGGVDSRLSGRVRVSTHPILGSRFLVFGIAQFCEAHPNIDIDLDIAPQAVNLAENQADVAIRVTTSPPDDSIARRAAGFGYAVYASHDYLATHPVMQAPQEATWIGWDQRVPYPDRLKDEHFPKVPLRGRFAAIASQYEAAVNGMGLAALPCFMADAEPRLARLSEPHEASAVYVLRHPDHRSTARVRAFYEHIRGYIEAQAAILEGRRTAASQTKGKTG